MSQMSTHHHKRNAPRPDGRDAWGQPDRSPSLLVLLLAFAGTQSVEAVLRVPLPMRPARVRLRLPRRSSRLNMRRRAGSNE